jgi:hypothetical protein
MIRLLLIRTMGRIASGALLVLLAATVTAADSWIAKTGLTIALLILLTGGTLLFSLGIRDLIRDLRHFLRLRSEKKAMLNA